MANQKILEAQLTLAEVKLQNVETLQSRNVSSEMQLLEAQAQLAITAASVEGAVAKVQFAEHQLDQTKLLAPIDGMISRPLISVGAYLTSDTIDKNRLAIVTKLDPIHVVAEIPFDRYMKNREAFDGRGGAGERTKYTLLLSNGVEYPYEGRLLVGRGEFNPNTQVMAIVIEFANPAFLLRPGFAVTLKACSKNADAEDLAC